MEIEIEVISDSSNNEDYMEFDDEDQNEYNDEDQYENDEEIHATERVRATNRFFFEYSEFF